MNHARTIIEPIISNKLQENSTTPIVKNKNPDWHSLTVHKQCKICGQNKSRSILHYVNVHPTSEVFPSRLAPHAADLLRSPTYNPNCKKKWCNNKLQYGHLCLFCMKEVCTRKDKWIEHIIRHTGYCKLQCGSCSMKMIRASKHRCNGIIKRIDQPQFAGEKFISFICNSCNFIRFNKSEIEQHLRNEHERNNVTDDGFKEITFLSFAEQKCRGTENKTVMKIASGYVDGKIIRW